MPLFRSNKQPGKPSRSRNPAADHNARAHLGTAPTPQPGPISPETPLSDTDYDKRLDKIIKSGQNAPLPPSPAPSPQTRSSDSFDWSLRPPSLRKSLKAAQNLHKVLAVMVDIGLLLVVLILALSLKNVKATLTHVLGGLYENFVLMDNASISTTVQVNDAPIPVSFNLPVVQPETNVTLTQPVTIQAARVTITSGALTIDNAPATVTLPAGTILPVSLNMDVPVQTTLLVDLVVPVSFKLSEARPPSPVTSLHDAFIGLQNTVGPFYCYYQLGPKDPGSPACQGKLYTLKNNL